VQGLPDYHDLTPCARVAVPHHFNTDPDLSFHFNADPYPTLHFIADLDFARNLILLAIKVMRICYNLFPDLQGTIFSLNASIVSVHSPSAPRLYFEPLKLLHFDFNVWGT
jgi:hypothetical protein